MSKYIISASAFFVLLVLETYFPLFSGWQKRIRHITRNIVILVINNLVFLVLLASATAFIFVLIDQHQIGIFNQLPIHPILRFVLILFVFDLWMYIWHRLLHQTSFLWRFHRMHHSDPTMDASTAFRFHPGEIIISTILRWGIFLIIGMTVKDLIIYEMIMLPINSFHHSNFYLPEKIDKIFRQIIVTPWMHWVHHSHIYEETNSNYGTVFSWWDRLATTFRFKKNPKIIKYGIDEINAPYWQTILGMIKTPFVRNF